MQVVNGAPNNVYDEEVHENCTVIVHTNIVNGEKSFIWWDNENPSDTFQQEE